MVTSKQLLFKVNKKMTIIYLIKCIENCDLYLKRHVSGEPVLLVQWLSHVTVTLQKRQDSCTQPYQDVSHPLEDSTHSVSTHHLLCIDCLPLHAVCDTRVSWWPNVRGTCFTIILSKYTVVFITSDKSSDVSYRGLCMFKQYFLNWCDSCDSMQQYVFSLWLLINCF